MSKLVLNGDVSGSVTLDAPSAAGTTTLTLPTTSGTILTDSSGVLNIGSGQLYKDASGNVGIGTTTPTEKLEIVASSPASLLTSNSTTGYSILRLRNTATSGRTYEWVLGGSNTGAQSGAMYLYDGTAAAVRMQIDSSGNLQFNSGYGSAATAYGCRAWVNFNGTGTVAIRASGNVTSITDNGTGLYTINFTTAMPDANYAIAGAGHRVSGSYSTYVNTDSAAVQTTSACRIATSNDTGALVDPTYVTVAIFR